MYNTDPLVYHMGLKAKWTVEFLRGIDVGREAIKSISIPALIFHGTEDKLVPFTASEFVHANISSSDKKFEVSRSDHPRLCTVFCKTQPSEITYWCFYFPVVYHKN